MISLKELKMHTRNVRIFRAYSFFQLAKQTVLFPFDYYFRNGESSHLLNISFFVTLRCNAHCTMCNLKDILNGTNRKEPTLDEIDKFLSSIRRIKPIIILFGGEPFIRNDIVDIVALVKKRGFTCGMFTNGFLLNKKIIDNLTNLNIDFIAFSIQGMKNTHDKIVGIKGAFDKLLWNMEFFIKSRSHTKVIMHITITEENLEELVDLASLGKKKGVDLIRFSHPIFLTPSEVKNNKKVCKRLFPEGEISEMSYIYNPEGKGSRYYNAIKKLKKRFGSDITFVPDLELREFRDWYSDDFKTKRKCLYLWRSLCIYPNGDVYPCEALKYPIGNIYKEDFEKIWNNERYIKLRRVLKKGLLPACARCCKL